MKFLSLCLISFFLLGCGILEMLFPINNMPQRYIERSVSTAELIGTWQITPDSESNLQNFLILHQNEDWNRKPVRLPWRTIHIQLDGTCRVDFKIAWAPESLVFTEPDPLVSCTWDIEDVEGFDKDLSQKDVLGVVIRLGRFSPQDIFYTHDFEVFIVEENNELVLWNFIGYQTDLQFQDFKKINQ